MSKSTSPHTTSEVTKTDWLKKKVHKHIIDNNDALKESAIKELAKVEIELRKKLIIDAYEKVNALHKDFVSFKPNKNYNADGEVVEEYYDEKSYKKRNEIKHIIERIENALDSAIESADYETLKKLSQSGKI